MSSIGDFGHCHNKCGLFFLRDCKSPATRLCDTCGRPVCPAHQIVWNEGTLCGECFVAQARTSGDATQQADDVNLEGKREEFYNKNGYRPFYSGHHQYFSDADFQTFENRKIIIHKKGETRTEADDEDDLENPLES